MNRSQYISNVNNNNPVLIMKDYFELSINDKIQNLDKKCTLMENQIENITEIANKNMNMIKHIDTTIGNDKSYSPHDENILSLLHKIIDKLDKIELRCKILEEKYNTEEIIERVDSLENMDKKIGDIDKKIDNLNVSINTINSLDKIFKSNPR